MDKWREYHGPDELYNKFEVIQVKSGTPLPNEEFVFVLRPERDRAAALALMDYADYVEYRSPNLAMLLRDKMVEIERWNSTK